MTDRLFFDTNVLVYSLDPAIPDKRRTAATLLRKAIDAGLCVVSPQTLNECYRVLTDRRNLMSRVDARVFIGALIRQCEAPLDGATIALAFGLQDELQGSWWDSLMVASALQARCRLFLSEDLQDGREVRGLRIVDPFKTSLHHIIH